MMRPLRLQISLPSVLTALAVVVACILHTSPVQAQLHWDVAGEVGVEKRFLRARPPEGADAGFGPLARITGHVALLPLIRVGAYGAFSYSPVRTNGGRSFFGGGFEARLVPPLRLPDWHPYLFVGFGYTAVRVSAFDSALGKLPAAGGGCIDIPLGIGVTHRLRKPIEIGGVLGTRFSAACSGSAYSGDGRVTDSGNRILNSGTDLFGLYLGALLNVEL
jgi:hypothetical protein